MYLAVCRTRRGSELSSLQQLRDRERELEREVETLREEKEREVTALLEERGKDGERLEQVKENSRAASSLPSVHFDLFVVVAAYCS